MKNHKRLLSLVLTFVLALSLGVPALAAVEDTGFSDVDAGAWYAEAVMYCREHGLMSGIGNNQFAPESSLTRAQLAAVLYRIAGSPAVTGTDSFTDTVDGAWYSSAVLWASRQGLVSGYGGGLFGPNDPMTREQMTAIFWRYAGSPAAGSATLSDGEAASSYALSAINWAVSNGIVTPISGTAFAPRDNATRAQVAAALMNYDRMAQPSSDAKILVAYFTVPETSGVDAVAQASRVVENGEVVGNVEFIANTIQEETGGDIFAIETVQTYPGEHQALLDFVAAEMAANTRPELSTSISNLSDYDVIFLGYPIWNADLPTPVYSFLDTYDLSNKTVIPFTAHGGSGFAGTISAIRGEEPNARVESNGFSVSRNSVSSAKNDIIDWVRELGYTKTASQPIVTPASSNVLVAYFSASNNTETVAGYIASELNADQFEIVPAVPYTSADLNWSDANSRVNREHEDTALRNIELASSTVENWDEYDTVFIGYPIWWAIAAWPTDSFVKANDFTGKTVIPFCTSSSSGLGESGTLLAELAGTGNWLEGQRFRSGASQTEVQEWVRSLNLSD